MAARLRRYSVLLRFPEWMVDDPETFYHWVKARNPEEAAVKAIRAAVRRNKEHFFYADGTFSDIGGSPADFGVELVVRGWHRDVGADCDRVRESIDSWAAGLKGKRKCEKQKKRR